MSEDRLNNYFYVGNKAPYDFYIKTILCITFISLHNYYLSTIQCLRRKMAWPKSIKAHTLYSKEINKIIFTLNITIFVYQKALVRIFHTSFLTIQ